MEMGNDHYQISEASKILEIEAHVLRYWEEELGINIPRSEMGHRLYTENHMSIFRKIQEMKEEGFQLRAIRRSLEVEFPEYLQELNRNEGEISEINSPESNLESIREDMEQMYLSKGDQISEGTCYAPVHVLGTQEEENFSKEECLSETSAMQKEDRQDKMEQFQSLMGHIVAQAMENNNEKLVQQISDNVTEQLIHEMDIMSRYQEEREEEHFRRLDETIRCCQQTERYRREVAAARSPLSIFRGKNRKKKFRKRSI